MQFLETPYTSMSTLCTGNGGNKIFHLDKCACRVRACKDGCPVGRDGGSGISSVDAVSVLPSMHWFQEVAM
jgi:hypothetical protein